MTLTAFAALRARMWWGQGSFTANVSTNIGGGCVGLWVNREGLPGVELPVININL